MRGGLLVLGVIVLEVGADQEARLTVEVEESTDPQRGRLAGERRGAKVGPLTILRPHVQVDIVRDIFIPFLPVVRDVEEGEASDLRADGAEGEPIILLGILGGTDIQRHAAGGGFVVPHPQTLDGLIAVLNAQFVSG